MSRYYDEDWQRKKAYLIRSLLHDYHPTSLSTVWEDSSQSTDTPPSGVKAQRPYSPLPPLVVEIVDRTRNRHDEPEQYYKILEKKILRYYRKLFIDGQDLSDAEYLTNSTDVIHCNNDADIYVTLHDNNESSMGQDTALDDIYYDDANTDATDVNLCDDIVNNKASDDHQSDTNGYSADFESYESEDVSSNNNDGEDENNNSTVNDDENQDISKIRDDNDEVGLIEAPNMSTDYATEEESGVHFRQITTQAQIHVDGASTAIETQSIIYEGSQRSPNVGLQIKIGVVDTVPSPILPLHVKVQVRGMEEGSRTSPGKQETMLLEEIEDPEKLGMNLTETTTNEDIEIMRSPLPDMSADSIPRSAQPDSDVTSEHDVIHEVSNITVPNSPDVNITRASSYNFTFDNVTKFKKRETGLMKSGIFHASRLSDQFNVINISHGSEWLEQDMDQKQIMDTETIENVNRIQHKVGTDMSNVIEDGYVDDDERRKERQSGVIPLPSDDNTSREVLDVAFLSERYRETEIALDVDTGVIATELNGNVEGSRKRKAREDVGVQAVPEIVDWNDINTNLFVGAPKIFRLCSCMNHDCY